ncbi:hypothetical protein [Streptomyces sp. AK02-01A]|uniref:hypothetical protein n=1 Tax=Streptomyces sp. AK02-01A TaxID=3028648 RepID=UPI0029A99CE3|nr:hypothetical protein [Streptomyces sp. AK02-01A]MDX3850946.1 hypothetical protein [Streptomyces sp. AK02-01A]
MRRLVRTSVIAAGLVAALALTGCGAGDSGADPAEDRSGTAASGPTGSGAPDSGGDAASGGIDGTWAALTDGKAVALSVKAGKVALVADQHVCQGSVEDMGEPMLSLKCPDGNSDRTMGAIESNDGKTLVISWGSGKKDTLTKTVDGKLPGGPPTSVPSL